MYGIDQVAAVTLPELTPIFALFAGMLVAFYGALKAQSAQHSKTLDALAEERKIAAKESSIERRSLITSGIADRENEREERRALIAAIDRMATNSERQAMASERAADEAKERNGHLAELELQSQEMFQRLADRNFEAITHVNSQIVQNQVVEHEVVKEKDCDKTL